MNDKAVDVMNDMVQLDLDAIVAYDEAIEACEVDEIRAKLGEFRGDHHRHVRDLTQLIHNYGGEPKEERDVKGFVIQGFTKVTSRGDHSALLAMRGNEELTNRSYDAAVAHEVPSDVKSLLEKNRDDERRHLEWIRNAIDRRLWESESTGAPSAL